MTSNRPAYRQVADQLRAAITEGQYVPGAPLPGDKSLAELFTTNRGSVGQAVRLLLAEGYLIRKGRNYAVSPLLHKIRRDANARYTKSFRESAATGTPARGAFDSEVRALGMRALSETTVDRVTPPGFVAELLGVSADEISALARSRRMLADDTPVQLATSYIPGEVAFGSPLEDVDTGAGGMISRLAELGLTQAHISEEINVRPPSTEEIESLQLAEDARVYELVHVAKTAEGRVIEVAVHVMPTHQWTLRYGWEIEPTS
ncbi:GntR family transcriptional regulator (plasmid) [Kitasatospora sp. CMC57]|uniref:GntR family transcriptional regulator n=1 Tax=Kitasatospora sp. CMC57 TaxID=3231513 RepID=A0AB33K904_9ACTN